MIISPSVTATARPHYRPPLFPLLMAASYKVFGRGFTPVLVMNYLFMAMACALAFLLSQTFSPLPGMLCAARFIGDPGIRHYSNTLLTESLACVLVIFFTRCLYAYG